MSDELIDDPYMRAVANQAAGPGPAEDEPVNVTWYLHKYEVSQQYGGPEEGGWWYNLEVPVPEQEWPPLEINAPADEDLHIDHRAIEICCRWNEAERERRKELDYGFTSVLSYRETFYSYDVSTDAQPHQPTERPHYE